MQLKGRGYSHEKCPECNTRTLIYDFKKGEVFCYKCGLVIADNLIDIFHDEATIECEECGSLNSISDDKNGELLCGECGAVIEEGLNDRRHIGTPMMYRIYDKGLSTLVTWSSYRLKRIHGANTTTERRRIYALYEIDMSSQVDMEKKTKI